MSVKHKFCKPPRPITHGRIQPSTDVETDNVAASPVHTVPTFSESVHAWAHRRKELEANIKAIMADKGIPDIKMPWECFNHTQLPIRGNLAKVLYIELTYLSLQNIITVHQSTDFQKYFFGIIQIDVPSTSRSEFNRVLDSINNNKKNICHIWKTVGMISTKRSNYKGSITYLYSPLVRDKVKHLHKKERERQDKKKSQKT